jgi:hypothetical protein
MRVPLQPGEKKKKKKNLKRQIFILCECRFKYIFLVRHKIFLCFYGMSFRVDGFLFHHAYRN